MPSSLRHRVQTEFNNKLRHFRESVDPYKFAIYKLMGRCDLKKRTVQEVNHTTEDYLWFQVSSSVLIILKAGVANDGG